MTAGKLDQRIRIESLSEANDGGEMVQTLSLLADVWAEVISQKGSEAFEAARINASETVRVRVRYRDDVTTKHHIVWMGQNYNISAVDRSKRRDGDLWFTAELSGAL